MRGPQQKLTFRGLPSLSVPVNTNYNATGKYLPANNGEESDATAFVHVGEKGAEVAFNAGDGSLIPAEVEWGVPSVLSMRSYQFPDLPLVRVIAAAYDNSGDARAFQYEHPESMAVAAGVRAVASLAECGGLLVTTPFDPGATEQHTLSRDRCGGFARSWAPSVERCRVLRGQGRSSGLLRLARPPAQLPVDGRVALARNDVVFPRTQ